MARTWRLARQRVCDVVAVEVHLERLLPDTHTLQELLGDVRHAGGRQQRGQHVFVREDIVQHRAGFDHAGPANGRRHAEAALPVGVLLAAERRRAAVGPREFLRAVVGRVHDDGVFVDAEILQRVQQFADVRVVFDHAVGIDAETRLAARRFLQPRPDVHARRVPPDEERLVGLLRIAHEADRLLGDFVVDGLHALLVERARAFDLLRAVRVRPRVDDAARAVLLRISGSLK